MSAVQSECDVAQQAGGGGYSCPVAAETDVDGFVHVSPVCVDDDDDERHKGTDSPSFVLNADDSGNERQQPNHVSQRPQPVAAPLDDFATGQFLRQDSLIIKVRPGEAFSAHADVIVDQRCSRDPRFGTLGQLRHHVRTGTKDQVKKFLRANHWPSNHRIRAELWKELCADTDHDGRLMVYRETIERMQHSGFECRPSAVHAADMVIDDHLLKATGRRSLLRLLAIVEHIRPDFTYVPILYALAALLLHYMAEEEAYCCLVQMLERKACVLLLQTDIAVAASRKTLHLLTKKYKNHVYSYIKKLLRTTDEDEIQKVFDQWKWWIFCDLPFEHLVRIVDCFMFEGQKVLFRVALALLHYWYRHRRHAQPLGSPLSAHAVGRDVRHFAENITVGPDKLIKTAFSIRNLKMSTIHKLQESSELKRRQLDASLNKSASAMNMRKMTSAACVASVAERVLNDTDGLIKPHMALTLCSWLPTRLLLYRPRLVFSLREHGTSFHSFWHRVDQCEMPQTLIVVESEQGWLFGAYVSAAWSDRKLSERSRAPYFGTGETFLFQLVAGAPTACANGQPKRPSAGSRLSDRGALPAKFSWVGADGRQLKHNQELFQAAGNTWLKVGGGGGDGLSLSDSLSQGSSTHCDTFDNDPLAGERDFDVKNLFVFEFMLE